MTENRAVAIRLDNTCACVGTAYETNVVPRASVTRMARRMAYRNLRKRAAIAVRYIRQSGHAPRGIAGVVALALNASTR